jgi:hypothetical protein
MRSAISVTTLALAVIGMLAFLASPALGVELCSAKEAACSEAHTYGDPTALEASTTEAAIETSLGNLACHSTIKGETLAEVAEPLPGVVNSLTFTECKLGGTACTVEAKGLPYYTNLSATTEGNGDLLVPSEAKAKLSASLSCSSGLKCTYGAEAMELEVQGAEKATIVAGKEPLERESGFLCSATATFTAKYAVSAPAPVWVEAATTKLCKTSLEGAEECPAGQAYSGGIKAYLPGANEAKVVSLLGPPGTVSCTEAPIVGSFGAMGSGRGEVTSFTMKTGGVNCPSSLNGTPTVAVTVENLPANQSTFLYRQSGFVQGTLQASGQRNLKLRMVPTGAGTECVYILLYRAWRVENPPLAPPIPMAITATAWRGPRTEGLTTVCPAQVEIRGTWYVETAGNENLWLARN